MIRSLPLFGYCKTLSSPSDRSDCKIRRYTDQPEASSSLSHKSSSTLLTISLDLLSHFPLAPTI